MRQVFVLLGTSDKDGQWILGAFETVELAQLRAAELEGEDLEWRHGVIDWYAEADGCVLKIEPWQVWGGG